jgi:hypothetical protein
MNNNGSEPVGSNNGAEPVDAPDPFDPKYLRLVQKPALSTRKQLVAVPVRRPGKFEWFRICPDEEYRLDASVIDLKDEGETYMVAPPLRTALEDLTRDVRLHLAVSTDGTVFLIPHWLPDTSKGSSRNRWSETALTVAGQAMLHWVKRISDKAAGGYHCEVSLNPLEPAWPAESMHELLKLAFGTFHIASLDHPVVKKIRGHF